MGFNILNPQIAIVVIAIWMTIVCILMSVIGFVDSPFFHFGPSSNVHFFNNTIDTWKKWGFVVIYTVINQFIQTYGLETITPWMINEVQNKRTRTLHQSPTMIQCIIQIWYIYMWSGRIFGIQIMLTQIDFLLVVLISDLIATFITTRMYITSRRADSEPLDEAFGLSSS